MTNIRYITATHIGTWAQDKMSRFTLLPTECRTHFMGLWLRGEASRALCPVDGG